MWLSWFKIKPAGFVLIDVEANRLQYSSPLHITACHWLWSFSVGQCLFQKLPAKAETAGACCPAAPTGHSPSLAHAGMLLQPQQWQRLYQKPCNSVSDSQRVPFTAPGSQQVPLSCLQRVWIRPVLLSCPNISTVVWYRLYSDKVEGTVLLFVQGTKQILDIFFIIIWEEKFTYYMCWGTFLSNWICWRRLEVQDLWAALRWSQCRLMGIWGADGHGTVVSLQECYVRQ